VSARKLEDVLARMRLPPTTRITVEIACQIAEREGAAGVLAGQVLPLGDSYVLTASVLQPLECREVIGASAVAPRGEVAAAAMALSRELRRRLGESRAAIRGSPPMIRFTAASTKALQLIDEIQWQGANHDSARYRERALAAIQLEPDFALAYLFLGLSYDWWGEWDRAIPYYTRAYELRESLPRKDRLFVEALYYRTVLSDPRAALDRLERLVTEHPEVAEPVGPFVAVSAAQLGDAERLLDVSLDHVRRWPPGDAYGNSTVFSHANAAWGACAVGRPDLVADLLPFMTRVASDLGYGADAARLEAAVSCNQWREADRLCEGGSLPDWSSSLVLVRGKLRRVASALEPLLDEQGPALSAVQLYRIAATLAEVNRLRDTPDRGWRWLERARQRAPIADIPRPQRHLSRYILCTAAADLGSPDAFAECAIEGENPAEWDGDGTFHWVLRTGAWSRRLLAVRSLARGDANAALRQARGAIQANFGSPAFADHVVMAEAFDALSRPDSAMHHYIQSTRPGGNCFSCYPLSRSGGAFVPHVAFALRRTGELAEAAGDRAMALEYYQEFVDLWDEADAELQPQVDAVRRRMALLLAERAGVRVP
jgi:tetratricopeptide (TPR) repeat protein